MVRHTFEIDVLLRERSFLHLEWEPPCSSPRSVGRVLVIDYSSSARDVPSSTPTAHCQTKRTPFFFPPHCFSRSCSRIRPRFYLPRGHRPWTTVVCARRYSPRTDAFFAFLSTAPGKGRIILQVHGASNRSHFPQTFSLRWRLQILFCSLHTRARARLESRNTVTQIRKYIQKCPKLWYR